MRSLYVDDIVTGEDAVHQVRKLKRTAIEVSKGQVSNCISRTLMYQNLKQIISRRSGGIRKQSRGTLSRESLEIWLNGPNWPSKAECGQRWCKLSLVKRQRQKPS